MRGPLRTKLYLLGLSLLFSFVLAEALARALSTTDADGNVFFRDALLHPYRLPVHAVEAKVAEYLALSSGARTVYDPDLGWTHPRGYTSDDGLYHYDEVGARSAPGAPARSPAPARGVLRIALFGDSFTHGDSVPFTATWGAHLEAELRARGLANAEVVNLGVSGYGMDQAFLRWEKTGRALAPQVVVFGFQAENMRRNLNLVRPLYARRTDLPFTKPRFVIEAGGLRAINLPAVPPTSLPALLRDFSAWELAPEEHSYHEADYADHPWLTSRLVALGLHALGREKSAPDDAPAARAPADLALRIIDAFAADVRATGARFVVVHLPRKHDVAALRAGFQPSYAAVLHVLEKKYPVADPTEGLLRAADTAPFDSLFADLMGHYAEPSHVAVAAALSEILEPGEP